MTLPCDTAVLPLDGPDLMALLRTAVARARKRVWALQFVADARPSEDRYGEIRYLVHALGEAASRGVDVRLLLPILMAGPDASYDLNEPVARFAAARGVAVRRYAPAAGRPHLHAKTMLVDDDLAIVGNANWTPSAFRLNTEQAVAARSEQATRRMALRFAHLWRHDARPFEQGLALRTLPSAAGPEQLLRNADLAVSLTPHGPEPRPKPGRYWPARRPRRDPIALYWKRGEALHDALRRGRDAGNAVAVLAGQPYVRTTQSLINGARSNVRLAMFGLRASKAPRLRSLLHALGRAVARGVDVRVLHDGGRDVSHLASDVGMLSSLGVPHRAWPLDSRMHARTMLVDGMHALVGSVAWTPQSVYLSEEQSLHIGAHDAVDAMGRQFDARWRSAGRQPGSDPIAALAHADLAARWTASHRLPPPVARLLAFPDADWGPCGPDGRCTDTDGSYQCTCTPGFSAPATGEWCADIDECDGGTPCGAGGVTCTNTYGSYRCTCAAGYVAPPSGGTCTMTDACVPGADGGCE